MDSKKPDYLVKCSRTRCGHIHAESDPRVGKGQQSSRQDNQHVPALRMR
jgi:hypothetical protein